MQKKIIAALILLVLVVFGFWWLGGNEKVAEKKGGPSAKLNVVVSGYVPYALAKQIGGENINLSILVPPGTEPHHFEPTPGSIIAVNGADLFVYVSPRMEPWAADILKGLETTHTLAAGLTDADDDPHVWITPYGALSMAKRIAEALKDADPAHKKEYQKNLDQFEQEIAQLHEDYKTGLANCRVREVVHVGHLAFGRLAQMYGLNFLALSGTSHQGEHSVHKLTELVRHIRKHGLPAVFTEEMISPDSARTVAAEATVKVLPLYTVAGVSKQDFEAGKTYIDFMRQNLKSLQEGLQCRP